MSTGISGGYLTDRPPNYEPLGVRTVDGRKDRAQVVRGIGTVDGRKDRAQVVGGVAQLFGQLGATRQCATPPPLHKNGLV